jgi:Uma2 family endonuclease
MAVSPEKVGQHYITLEEYLKIEDATGERHDWENGRVYNMAGASYPHNTIVVNIVRELSVQLRGKPCQPFSNDLRVTIPGIKRRTYPDVAIACPPLEWDNELPHTLLNPCVVIEVLSPSTQRFDRINKRKWYKRIPSLTDYIMIASEAMEVTRVHLNEGVWGISHILDEPEQVLELPEYSCRMTLEEIYERLGFEKPEFEKSESETP